MGQPSLTDDGDYLATGFVVIDFETTTPAGHRPEPIEVAAIALHAAGGQLREVKRFSALMKPPDHAPLTPFDTEQTGITAAMLAGQPPAADVLARLDSLLDQPPYLLVAHHAPTEAGVLGDYRRSCPTLAATDFLDTVRLARVAYPDLPSYSLDVLIHHLGIPRPPDRHRALPDVEATAEVFTRLVGHGVRSGRWRTLRQLRDHGGVQAKGGRPEQQALF